MAGEKHAREDSALRNDHPNDLDHENDSAAAIHPALDGLANLPPAKRRSSAAVSSGNNSQSRTGQACDRCKARYVLTPKYFQDVLRLFARARVKMIAIMYWPAKFALA